jgi:hypothetical protein
MRVRILHKIFEQGRADSKWDFLQTLWAFACCPQKDIPWGSEYAAMSHRKAYRAAGLK